MLERGDLKGFRHGKMWRIPYAEVAQFEGESEAPELEAVSQPNKPKVSQREVIHAAPTLLTYGWPQAMKRRTAAAYCDISVAAFNAAVSNQL
jgi:hypothetical protein